MNSKLKCTFDLPPQMGTDVVAIQQACIEGTEALVTVMASGRIFSVAGRIMSCDLTQDAHENVVYGSFTIEPEDGIPEKSVP